MHSGEQSSCYTGNSDHSGSLYIDQCNFADDRKAFYRSCGFGTLLIIDESSKVSGMGKRSQVQGDTFGHGRHHMLGMDNRRSEEGELGSLGIGKAIYDSGARYILDIGCGHQPVGIPEGDGVRLEMASYQGSGEFPIAFLGSIPTLVKLTGKEYRLLRSVREGLVLNHVTDMEYSADDRGTAESLLQKSGCPSSDNRIDIAVGSLRDISHQPDGPQDILYSGKPLFDLL